ncbi:DUF3592 domain-containing protein [Streptomyces sp. NBC_00448]|uniref:DUF3592 domain-containing protein n=1 Tax=Streptomyces sp. NBC_00448 TaxID=2903652 RepID=UPI002E1C327B
MPYDVAVLACCAVVGAFGVRLLRRHLAFRGRGIVYADATVTSVGTPLEHGGKTVDGVPAELAFVDRLSGREVVGPARGGRYGRLNAAWEGRTVEVRYGAHAPEDFRLGPHGHRRPATRELACGSALLYLALVPVAARFLPGPDLGWVLLLYGLGWSAVMWAALRRAVLHDLRRRRRLRVSAVRTTARVLAVRERRDPRSDDRGTRTYSPIVAFTTEDGRTVTALCGSYTSTRRAWPGRDIAVRYDPADPAVLALDREHDHDGLLTGVIVLAVLALAGAAAAVIGAILLATS